MPIRRLRSVCTDACWLSVQSRVIQLSDARSGWRDLGIIDVGTQWRTPWRLSLLIGSVLALLASALLVPLAGVASATAPQIGVLLQPGTGSGTALPINPIPTITDQTAVEVQVPANSIRTAGDSLHIYECVDADGMADDLPTNTSSCDGLTIDSGRTINVSSTGSVDKFNYPIYVLPSLALDDCALSFVVEWSPAAPPTFTQRSC